MASYLVRSRHGTQYYFRYVVPLQYQAVLGVKEIRRSLRTSDRKLARALAAELVARLTVQISTMKKKTTYLADIATALMRPDGTMQLEGVRTDPLHHEAEIAALKALLNPASAVEGSKATADYGSALKGFIDEQQAAGAWTPKTQQEVESILKRYETACKDQELNPFSKEAATRYKAENLLKREWAVRTVNKHLTQLSTFFGWCKRHGYTSENVFEAMGLKAPKHHKASAARDAYTPDEVERLLAALNPSKDCRHWFPLLGLYTGARSNELAQLRLDDIRQDADTGIWYVDINANTPDKSLKTSNAARAIPVHDRLLRAGLLGYVEEQRRAGKERLFGWARHPKNGYAHYAGKWFKSFRDTHKLKDFHSLRHTVATALREAGVPEDVINEILGHAKGGSISFAVYAKASTLGKLKDAICHLSFG